MEKLKVLELFAGIGACSKALEKLGIEHEIVDAVEIDKYAVKSFNAIHNTNFEPQDITQWDKQIDVDLIMHGSPCQDFSLAGLQAGGDEGSGTRSSLMYETIRIVKKLKPKYVIWENVKNLLSKKHRHNFDSYLEIMESLGYKNYYQVLNAKDYGIPQNRERVFTISIRKDIQISDEIKLSVRKNFEREKQEISKTNKEIYQCECESGWQDNKVGIKVSPTIRANNNNTFILEDNIDFKFPPKQELKLKLKDMLEDCVDEKYFLSDKQIQNIKCSTFHQNNRRIQEKDYADTLCARDWKDPKCVQVVELPYYNYESDRRVYSPSGVSPCIRSKEPNQKIDIDDVIRNKALKETLENNDIEKDVSYIDSYNRNIRNDDLSGTITTRVSDSNNTFIAIKNATKQGYLEATDGDGIDISSRMEYHRGNVQKDSIQTITTSGGNDRGVVVLGNYSPSSYESSRVVDKDGLAPTIKENHGTVTATNVSNLRIRKLTPKECWRLQGFDDSDFDKASKVNSNSQLYKQAGNSIVVNVLEAILKELLSDYLPKNNLGELLKGL